MRTVREQIHVTVVEARPTRVVWRGVPYQVLAVESWWQTNGKWWLDPERKGITRRSFRVTMQAPGRDEVVAEIFHQSSLWYMERMQD